MGLAEGRDGLFQPSASRSRAARVVASALPRLFCVMAQWSGTRSRVLSLSASRKAATASSSRVRSALALPQAAQRAAEIVLRRRPIERNALARLFLAAPRGRPATASSRRRRPALALPERRERTAEIVLRHRPIERNALAGTFLEGLAERRRPPSSDVAVRSRALPESASARPRLFCGHGPIERNPLAGPFLQRLAVGRDGLLQPRRLALALAEA